MSGGVLSIGWLTAVQHVISCLCTVWWGLYMYVMQKIHQKDQKGLGMKSSRHKRNRFSLTGFGQESVQSVIEISHHRSSAQNPFGASTWRTMKILRIYNGIHARYFLTICGQSVHVAKTMLFEFLNPVIQNAWYHPYLTPL